MKVAAVFVNGFDFGTTEEDLQAHMAEAGTVVSVDMKKGSAVVSYSSAAEAEYAVKSLNKSTVEGNSRFIDVQLDKKSMPPKEGGVKRSFSEGEGGSKKVLVRGFDFGTDDDQLWAHMGKVGTIEEVHWVTKGSANVVYSSASEATAAIKKLDQTTMKGNTRFIDVIPGGDRPAKKFKGGGKGGSEKGGTWQFVPAMPAFPAFSAYPAFGGKAKGGGKAGKGGKKKGGDHSDEDPAGSGRVFVRGFDFGTEDEQLEGHMKKAGPIHTVHWVNKGNAVVVYKKKASAVKAVNTLDNTTIAGNTRYINVTERN